MMRRLCVCVWLTDRGSSRWRRPDWRCATETAARPGWAERSQASSNWSYLQATLQHGFQPTQRTQFTQAPANRNRAVFFPAELKFLRLNFLKAIGPTPNCSMFYLLCNLRCKSHLISIISRVSATAWQRASTIRPRRWRLWLTYPMMTSFRYVPYVR